MGGEVAQRRLLDRGAGDAKLLPLLDLGDDGGTLVADRAGGVGEVGAQLGVAQGCAGGGRGRPACRRRSPSCRSPARSPTAGPDDDPRTPRCSARISARCITRTPARWRESIPPMCIRHELSPATRTSAPVSRTCRALSAPIAIEVSAFFRANVPPKPQHSSAWAARPAGCRAPARAGAADGRRPRASAGCDRSGDRSPGAGSRRRRR